MARSRSPSGRTSARRRRSRSASLRRDKSTARYRDRNRYSRNTSRYDRNERRESVDRRRSRSRSTRRSEQFSLSCMHVLREREPCMVYFIVRDSIQSCTSSTGQSHKIRPCQHVLAPWSRQLGSQDASAYY